MYDGQGRLLVRLNRNTRLKPRFSHVHEYVAYVKRMHLNANYSFIYLYM